MATYPIKMLRDEQGQPFVPLISLDSVQDTTGQNINEILDKKLEATNLIAGTQIELEVDGNNITISNSAEGTKLIDNLETEQAGIGALDAHQGKVLLEKIPIIANNLNTPESGQALSAYQGYVLAGRVAPTGGAEGQVLKKASTDDYDFEWGDAADPNAIVGDGSIMKIVELSYEEYLELKENNQLQDDTEYHINNWTESGHSEITATQVTTTDDYNVQEKLNNIDLIDEGQNTRLDVAEGNIDTIVETVNTLSTGLGKTLKMVYSGSSGGTNTYKDTGLSVEAGYGGGAYLVVMTWHLASGDPTGTTVDIISLPYSGTNFKQYRICELKNNDSYSKHLIYQASSNKTLEFATGGSGDAHIHIYKL